MIKEYFRPNSIHEAVALLHQNKLAIPIGGGTSLKTLEQDIIVIDLQDLALSYIENVEQKIIIGSTTPLENIKEYLNGNKILKKVLQIEGSKNQRIQSSLGGFLKLAGGRSPFLTCLLTLECTIFFAAEEKEMSLNDYLEERKSNNKLITHISINQPDGLVFESISRSPLDLPIICCALTRINSELRAAVGGFGERPKIVPEKYFVDKPERDITAYLKFSTDKWATANYRSNITQIVLKRLIDLTKKGNQ